MLFLGCKRFQVKDRTVGRLVRVTLAYCSHQDRVRLDGLSEGAETIRLWFTARLLLRLVPHLTEMACPPRHRLGGPINIATKSSEGHEPELVEVSLGEFCPELLVSKIDLKTRGEITRMIYADAFGVEIAELALSWPALQKWKAGIKKCFIDAGWPLDAFNDPQSGTTGKLAPENITLH